jgi:hypothetical protein
LRNFKKSKTEASTATKKNDSMVYSDDVIFKITPDKFYKMKGAKLPEAWEHTYLVAPDKPLPRGTEWGNHDAVCVYCTLCNKVIQYKGRVMRNVVNHWNTTHKASVTS